MTIRVSGVVAGPRAIESGVVSPAPDELAGTHDTSMGGVVSPAACQPTSGVTTGGAAISVAIAGPSDECLAAMGTGISLPNLLGLVTAGAATEVAFLAGGMVEGLTAQGACTSGRHGISPVRDEPVLVSGEGQSRVLALLEALIKRALSPMHILSLSQLVGQASGLAMAAG